MPVIDMTSHKCGWCDSTDRVFICKSCSMYTCRECLLGIDEAGCYHKKREIIYGQAWDDMQLRRLRNEQLREKRLQDS